MKNFHTKFLFILLISCSFLLNSCNKSNQKNNNRQNQVIAYSYSSFCGEWGAGPKIAALFKEKTGLDLVYVECESAVQILSRIVQEKNSPYADIIIGFDNNMIENVKKQNVLQKYKPKNANAIENSLIKALGGEFLLIPYDFSPFAIIWNSKSKITPPTCLEDLTNDIYKKKLILMNSKTSTPGLGFETWVQTVYKNSYDDFMTRLSPSILTMSPSWSLGYGMFTNGEAPLVISYSSSVAYHEENGEEGIYKALEFTDGHVMQVEGAGIVKNCLNENGAKQFIDFLISEQAQTIIPQTQWMYPVNKNVKLPKSYEILGNFKILD